MISIEASERCKVLTVSFWKISMPMGDGQVVSLARTRTEPVSVGFWWYGQWNWRWIWEALNHSKIRYIYQEESRHHSQRRAGQCSRRETSPPVSQTPWCIEDKGSNELWGLQRQWHSWTWRAARLEDLAISKKNAISWHLHFLHQLPEFIYRNQHLLV